MFLCCRVVHKGMSSSSLTVCVFRWSKIIDYRCSIDIIVKPFYLQTPNLVMNIAIARPISWTSNCSVWTFSVYIPQLKLWSSGIHLTIYFPVNIFSMNLHWFLFYQQHSWDADRRNFLLSLLFYNVNTQSNYLANNRAEGSSLWGSCVLCCFVRPVHRSHIASSAAYRRNCCSFRVLLSWRWSQSDTGGKLARTETFTRCLPPVTWGFGHD